MRRASLTRSATAWACETDPDRRRPSRSIRYGLPSEPTRRLVGLRSRCVKPCPCRSPIKRPNRPRTVRRPPFHCPRSVTPESSSMIRQLQDPVVHPPVAPQAKGSAVGIPASSNWTARTAARSARVPRRHSLRYPPTPSEVHRFMTYPATCATTVESFILMISARAASVPSGSFKMQSRLGPAAEDRMIQIHRP